MTRLAFVILLVLSGATCALAFFLGDYTFLAFIPLGLVSFWLLGLSLGWKWMPALGLFSIYALAVLAIWFRLSVPLAALSAFFALIAWDLSGFSFRLRLAVPQDETKAIQRHHLLVIGVTGLAGGIMSVLALLLRIQVKFEWIAVLALFSIWGIGRLIQGLLHKKH